MILKQLHNTITGKEQNIHGLWERYGDTFAGCSILVKETEDGSLAGTITRLPKSMARFGWIIGDLKWRSIHRTGKNKYKLEDLFKEVNSDTGLIQNIKYQPATIKLTGGSKLLLRIAATTSTPFVSQRWRKIGRLSNSPQ